MVLTEQLLFGFVTTLIGGLGTYIMIIEKRHTKEKKEEAERRDRERRDLIEAHLKEKERLLSLTEQQFEKLTEISEENHKIGREQVNFLAGIKTLIENQKK